MACVVVSIALVLAPTHSPDVVAAQLDLVTADGAPAPTVSTVGLSTPDGVPAATTQPTETAWPTSPPNASTAADAPTTSTWPTETPAAPESSSAATASPAPPVESPPLAPPPLTPAELGLERLAELGATGWQLRTFGCLAWFESKNNPYAVSVTNDHGLWQINASFHRWRWAGRDIYDPIVNAEVAWDIYRGSGFRAWTTARLCGV